jgi:predicted lipid carrier protein YhbT
MRLPAVAGLLVRPVPLWAIEAAANAAFRSVLRRRPRLFDRLDGHGAKRFAFAPTDLPLVFVVVPEDETIAALRPGPSTRAEVLISGPIVTLLALAEGRLDGDAAFFARDLSVDGDMEAALALRNAMDDCRIDLPTDLAPLAGPFRRHVELGLQAVRAHLLAPGAR